MPDAFVGTSLLVEGSGHMAGSLHVKLDGSCLLEKTVLATKEGSS